MKHHSKLGNIVRALFYFVGWGIFWGALLGALAGTLIFPVWGTLLSTGWGAASGAALGIGAAFLAAFFYPLPPTPEQAAYYRRRLTLVVGLITAMGAPVLILLTSYDFVWRSLISNYGGFVYWFLAPSLVAAGILGGLAAASTASRFATMTSGTFDGLAVFGNVVSSAQYFATHAAKWWVFMVAPTCVALYTLNDLIASSYNARGRSLGVFIEYFFARLIGTVIVIGLLSLGIGALISFLNRVYFTEYASHWALERYRIAVMVIAGAGTLGMAAFWLAQFYIIGAWLPVVGIFGVAGYAAYLARGYAEHYYDILDKPKRKGKPKNSGEVQALSAE